MNSLRKWFYRPRRDDPSLLAQFYYADEELNLVAGELDSFDGRKDPERCTSLVNQLRQCQDRVLNICMEMMDELLPNERAPRDFRIKFPDDVMQETLAGQLWFGAECLAAGSSILNREAESTRMRPLAKAVTKTIENVRNLLREQCLKPIPEYTEKICESLKIFDKLFADFELSYVSAMVPVKSIDEHDMQQNVVVLFSDTLQRASKIGLVGQEQIDNYDPALMFTIPRLAIISGLVIFPDGPLNLDKAVKNLSELFRPFRTLLQKIRELLLTMSAQELATLEKCLCSLEEPGISIRENLKEELSISPSAYGPVALTTDFIHKFYAHYPSCRQLTPELSSLCPTKKSEKNERKRDRHSSKSSRTRARQERQNERFLSRLTGNEERPRARRRTRRGSQHHHYYLPQDQDTWAPIPYQSQVVSETSHRNVTNRHTQMPYDANTREASNRYYASSSSNDHLYDSRHVSVHANRQHQRRQSHSSRYRRERINTIICACGSSGSHLPIGEDGRSNISQQYGDDLNSLDHQHVGDYSHSSHQRCIYMNPNYITHGNHDQFQEANHYDNLQQPESCFELSHSLDNKDDGVDVNRSVANMQNCVANAVSADPEILSPSSLYEPEVIYPESLNSADIVQDLRSTVTFLEGHFDDCLNPENCNCDIICNRQRNPNSFLEESNDLESPKQMPNEMERDTKYNTSCDSTSQEYQCSDITPESTQSSLDNSLDTPVPPSLPPIPGARSIRTSYRPYAKQTSEEENFDTAKTLEQKDHEQSDFQNHILINNSGNFFHSETVEGESSGSTSPHHSGTDDDEEVALALQAAEVAASWKARERFADSGDLIQRMFVCISGVADQLQTNYASDLRKILKCVFLMNQTIESIEENSVEIVSGKEHYPSEGEICIEDATSSNGSEQLSVESAEDALEAIGSPETVGRINSPDEMAELEEESEPHLLNEGATLHDKLHSGSVFVRPSVFNDHSHMQYSSISPPTFSVDHSYNLPVVEARDVSDNESPSNDISCSSGISNTSINQELEAVSDSLGQISLTAPNLQSIPSISVASAASSPDSAITPNDLASQPSSDFHNFGSDVTASPDNISSRRHPMVQEPPTWVPDQLAPRCMACGALFTVVRRRHHCRNCGKVFCGHCSRHSVPLPHFGIWKNVRVCNACFLYYVTSSADGSAALS